uniref:Putative ovule protein n=1 Tax=Solanum chacoense TaxID=4108 RepID=A0A0V0HL69_SOLCH
MEWEGKALVLRETIASSASMSMHVTGPSPFFSLNTYLTRLEQNFQIICPATWATSLAISAAQSSFVLFNTKDAK